MQEKNKMDRNMALAILQNFQFYLKELSMGFTYIGS